MDTNDALIARKRALLELLKKKQLLKQEKVLDSFVLNKPQAEFHESPKTIRLFTGGNGCHPKGTKILMATGELKAVEDVKLGDQLLGPDSTVRTVQKLYQGQEQMYDVYHDGIHPTKLYGVNESHILSLKYCSKEPRYGLHQYDVVNVPVKEYLTWSSRKRRVFMGYKTKALEFHNHNKDLPLDPYILGLWLGEGHSNTTAITNMEESVLNAWEEYSESMGTQIRRKAVGQAETLFLRKASGNTNPAFQVFKQLGVINNKHIPQKYLTAPLEARRALLAGIIDTDGYLANGTYVEVTQKNVQLAKDIVFLAQSLGLRVKRKTVRKSCQTGSSGLYERMNICGDIHTIPTRVPHKQVLTPIKKEKNSLHYIIKIVPTEVQDFYGFQLDGDNLYILEDFSVTHNSGKSTALIHELVHTHLKTHPHRDVTTITHSWLITTDLRKAEDYIDIIKKICPPSQLPAIDKMGSSTPRRILWKNGDKTTIFSAEQDTMSTESTSYDALFIDEPIPRDMYIAAYRGLRGNKDHFVCLALTALNEPWIYQDIYLKAMEEPEGVVAVIQARTLDNIANISEDWYKEFSASLTDDEKAVRLEGGFATLQGRVFNNFDRRIHVIEDRPWPIDWPVWLCIDPHTRKPCTALFVGVTKDDELIALDCLKAPSIEELGNMIQYNKKQRNYRVVSMRIDNSGSSSDWSGNTAIDILRNKCNLNVIPVTNDEKDVDNSIFRIKQLLQPETLPDGRKLPKLYMMRRCKDLINEMEMYGWRENRRPESTGVSEKVKKLYDDLVDPLRYIVMQHPRFNLNIAPISYGGGYWKKRRYDP